MKRAHFLASAAASTSVAMLPAQARAASPGYDLQTSSGTLFGTLQLPNDGRSAVPVVLIFSGSGPTDRDGNSPMLGGKNDALKLLAQGLATKGLASVRFDKRGIAASAAAMESESTLRFDGYADDGVAWVAKLRSDARFGKVVLAGHSEGALVATRVARVIPVDGLAALSGAGRRASVILREQLRPKLPPDLYRRADTILRALEAGQTVQDVPPELAALFRVSVQPYLISWIAYDPAVEFGAVTAARAIVRGTADVQVSAADADALAKAAPSAHLVIVQGMNHVLKHA
ncbi:MAG: alpha/beta hydrolase, partial [Candidatus Baltobacteraceae bacterium]